MMLDGARVHAKSLLRVCAYESRYLCAHVRNTTIPRRNSPTQGHIFKLNDDIILVCVIRSHPHISKSPLEKVEGASVRKCLDNERVENAKQTEKTHDSLGYVWVFNHLCL